MLVNAVEHFSICGWHLHNRCQGKGAWGCLMGLSSDVLHGEGVHWEDMTADGCRRCCPSCRDSFRERTDACKHGDCSSGTHLPFCACFTQNLHQSLVWFLLHITTIVAISYPCLQALHTGVGLRGPSWGGAPPTSRSSSRIPRLAFEGASAGPVAQAAGREWLSAQLPFAFQFHNAPMRLFNQPPFPYPPKKSMPATARPQVLTCRRDVTRNPCSWCNAWLLLSLPAIFP